jgi:hypothetical protein
LEIQSIEDYIQVLSSKMLSKLNKEGFASLVVNYPRYCTNNQENWTYLKKLSASLVVTIIVSKDLFPVEEGTHIVVDSL